MSQYCSGLRLYVPQYFTVNRLISLFFFYLTKVLLLTAALFWFCSCTYVIQAFIAKDN